MKWSRIHEKYLLSKKRRVSLLVAASFDCWLQNVYAWMSGCAFFVQAHVPSASLWDVTMPQKHNLQGSYLNVAAPNFSLKIAIQQLGLRCTTMWHNAGRANICDLYPTFKCGPIDGWIFCSILQVWMQINAAHFQRILEGIVVVCLQVQQPPAPHPFPCLSIEISAHWKDVRFKRQLP